MTHKEHAQKIVDKMIAADRFSQWLGIEIMAVKTGGVTLQMVVRQEMLNGFGVLHGGVTYAFADSALAFASNSHGRVSWLLKASMAYPESVKEGDILTAVAEEESLNNKIGVYRVTVSKNGKKTVGVFQGTVYRTKKEHLEEKETA